MYNYTCIIIISKYKIICLSDGVEILRRFQTIFISTTSNDIMLRLPPSI